MAKIIKVKARKKYICNKCKKQINVGEKYYFLKLMYQKPQRACLTCGFSRSETTSSSYYSAIWDIQDVYLNINCQDDINELINELELLREELEESLENIPEQLQDSSPNGELLQERIDNLDEIINELYLTEFPTIEFVKNELKENGTEDKIKEKMEELKENVNEEIKELLSELGVE